MIVIRGINNAMPKIKKIKKKTKNVIDETQHRKLKIEQHSPVKNKVSCTGWSVNSLV